MQPYPNKEGNLTIALQKKRAPSRNPAGGGEWGRSGEPLFNRLRDLQTLPEGGLRWDGRFPVNEPSPFY